MTDGTYPYPGQAWGSLEGAPPFDNDGADSMTGTKDWVELADERERVARLIDGVAFRPAHIHGPFPNETEKEKWLRARSVAYYKADQIHLVRASPPSAGSEDLREKLCAFSDFINEPPQYEELRMVRDYRHELARKWVPLLNDLLALAATPSATGREAGPPDNWEDDPSADERWNAGCDFAMLALCGFMGVDPHTVSWDAATETVDGDVRAVIGNILRAKMGEDWSPSTPQSETASGGRIDFDAAAWALGFRKLPNGKWFAPTPSPHMNSASTFDSAEQIFDWWGRANGETASPDPRPYAARADGATTFDPERAKEERT